MENKEKRIQALNDLILINNDRTAGYEKAAVQAGNIDTDLQDICLRFAEESIHFSVQLTQTVVRLGGIPANGTTLSGKIYRLWRELKSAFATTDKSSLLYACEFGEEHVLEVYESVLSGDCTFSGETEDMIVRQQDALQVDHDLIKKYREIQLIVR